MSTVMAFELAPSQTLHRGVHGVLPSNVILICVQPRPP
jgi:hypothetical protein